MEDIEQRDNQKTRQNQDILGGSEQPNHQNRSLKWRNEGLQRTWGSDIYFFLLAASWKRLLGFALAGYVLVNLAFAMLYYMDLAGIANARPGSFPDAFFFSVQTFSTIGFGAMSPQSVFSHILVTIESFAGLVAVALGTGLIFSKFSRPTAAVRFSDVAVIHKRNGTPCLEFRFVNERLSELLNVKLSLSAIMNEVTTEGIQMRRTYRLPLVREDIPIFALAWTAIHEIDESSPLSACISEGKIEDLRIFIASIEGTDATFLQTVQARHFYQPRDIRPYHRFKDMIHTDEDGFVLNHANLSETEAIEGMGDKMNG